MLEDDIAEVFRIYLHATRVAQFRFNLVDNFGFFLIGDIRTLCAGDADATIELLAVENLARTVGLDNDDGIVAHTFVGSEATAAFQAFTAAANGIEFVGRAGVYYLRFWMATSRTTHEILLLPYGRLINTAPIIHA